MLSLFTVNLQLLKYPPLNVGHLPQRGHRPEAPRAGRPPRRELRPLVLVGGPKGVWAKASAPGPVAVAPRTRGGGGVGTKVSGPSLAPA
jgi:hypothetical protein